MANPNTSPTDAETIKDHIRSQYGSVARSEISGAIEGARKIAEAFGYSGDELASIPQDAHMGLSCGNPTALAGIRPGEVVVDLGSGGGIDVFLAARKVGPTGRAIGIDMTPSMVERAQANAEKGGFANTTFLLGEIEELPLESNSVDCIISNCVLNLVPDKPRAFREIFRVLKPGGRLAASDIALKQDLPEDLQKDILAYVGCISGAILVTDYEGGLKEAGFGDVQIVDSGADLNAYGEMDQQSACCSPAMDLSNPLAIAESGCCSPSDQSGQTSDIHRTFGELTQQYNLNDYAASVKVYALKPPAHSSVD